jgi:ATP-grasp domain, R2K clade family 2
MYKQTILLIPEKTDIEFEQVFATWTQKGGQIKRLGKYWIKDDEISKNNIVIYGNQTFALILAQIYDVELVSPDDKLIARLEKKWSKREIKIRKINQIVETDFPIFIKPVIPKTFIAKVFRSYDDFQKVTKDIDSEEEIIVSSIIDDIKAEARAYLMNGQIKDLEFYEGSGNLENGHLFLQSFADSYKKELPKVVVTDIAYTENLGWFILEFNACWGAGLNNCRAEKVIDCIMGATINKTKK